MLKIIRFILITLTCASPAAAQMVTLDPNNFGKLNHTIPQSLEQDFNRMVDLGVLEPVLAYETGQIRKIANAVGLLDILRANGERDACTATLLNADTIITSNHCVPRTGPKSARSAILHLGYDNPEQRERVPTYKVVLPATEQNEILDFAILKLVASVPNFAGLNFKIRDSEPSEALIMIGHPYAAPLHVSRAGCRSAKYPIDGNTLNHNCNSLPGSSGSLIFADDWAIVGIHSGRDNTSDLKFATRSLSVDRASSQGLRRESIIIPDGKPTSTTTDGTPSTMVSKLILSGDLHIDEGSSLHSVLLGAVTALALVYFLVFSPNKRSFLIRVGLIFLPFLITVMYEIRTSKFGADVSKRHDRNCVPNIDSISIKLTSDAQAQIAKDTAYLAAFEHMNGEIKWGLLPFDQSMSTMNMVARVSGNLNTPSAAAFKCLNMDVLTRRVPTSEAIKRDSKITERVTLSSNQDDLQDTK